jgi:AcrR family transcriptional regulator
MHTTDTKQRLILSLLRLGAEKGLDNVSLSDLARENRITKASIFHHFSGREELVDRMFAYCSELAYGQQVTISFEGSAEEVLMRAMEHWHTVYTTEPLSWFYRIVESEKLTHAKAGAISRTLEEMFDGQSRVLLETLSETGRLDIEEPDLAVLLFSATVRRFLSRTMIGDDPDIPWQEGRFVSKFCRLFGNSPVT